MSDSKLQKNTSAEPSSFSYRPQFSWAFPSVRLCDPLWQQSMHTYVPQPRFDPPLLRWGRTTCVTHVTHAPMGWLHMVLSTRELVLIRNRIPWCVSRLNLSTWGWGEIVVWVNENKINSWPLIPVLSKAEIEFYTERSDIVPCFWNFFEQQHIFDFFSFTFDHTMMFLPLRLLTPSQCES